MEMECETNANSKYNVAISQLHGFLKKNSVQFVTLYASWKKF